MTDSKWRHARGWLLLDAECDFCVGIANSLMGPMKRRGLAVAPLQDPRVGSLLGLSQEELLRAICFVRTDGSRYIGVSAVLAVARELWWAWPPMWIAGVPGMRSVMQAGYRWGPPPRKSPADPTPPGR